MVAAHSDFVADSGCELCQAQVPTGCLPIVDAPSWRVVRVMDSVGFPAFYRVIWKRHVAEWTDLGSEDRMACMQVVATVEQVLREELRPRKINLASFGNMVAHLHWHVIARFDWDSHFPQPIWGAAQRSLNQAAIAQAQAKLLRVDVRVAAALAV